MPTINFPSPVAQTAVVPINRSYPHVDGIEDWRAEQSVRMAWDRIHALEERLQASTTTITNLTSTLNSLLTASQQILIQAEQAIAKTQQP